MGSSTPQWVVPPGNAFPVGPGASGTPGPPGIVQSSQVPPNFPRGHTVAPDSSSMLQRPSMPLLTGPPPPGSANRPQTGAPYQSLLAMAAPHQGLWLHPPPQMGGVFRPPNMPYAGATFPGAPFPSMARGIAPAIPLPDSQPPGVTSVNTGAVPLSSSATAMHQMAGSSAARTELHYSGDRAHGHGHDVGGQAVSAVNEHSDAWTAHKSEAGVIYYYNALTGESTYKKPPDYKGEPEKVSAQPVPMSMVNLPGTDWVLVNTSDGKKYYYNSKTKVSSWQIPNEVSELRKKQESDISKEPPMSVPNGNVVAEKGSTPPRLNAPAINTGGRDAMPLRPVTTQTSASALDLIKKKLQESGSPVTASQSGMTASESNGSRAVEAATKGQPSETSKDKPKEGNGDGNVSDSSSDSEDADSGPTKEECIIQFKEMLKDRGVAPFSKWEKELPKFVFDPRFKAIPSYSTRRTLFEHFVKTRVEEERKEKRAAQKVAVEGFKQLLDEVSEDIDLKTDYQSFRKKWGDDPRFLALERKDREHLLNERVLPLKRAAEEKAQAIRTAFKSMLREKGDITLNSRWSRVKDSLRDDPRYKSVKHEDREVFFNEYLSDLRSAKEEVEREAKAKRDEQDKLKERERELRKRKEREEQEMERVRVKVRRKEAIVSFQALLVESIKDPLASWTESKPRLDKDPQGRSSNSDLDPSEMEKLFREHIKMLQDRSARDYKSLLAETLTGEAATRETEDGKTALNSWSTAKRLLKSDHRYNKLPRKDREMLWYRFAEDFLRKQTSASNPNPKDEKKADFQNKSSVDSGWVSTGARK